MQYVTQRQLWLTERLQIYVLLTTDLLLPIREHFLKFLPIPGVKRLGTTALENRFHEKLLCYAKLLGVPQTIKFDFCFKSLLKSKND